MTCPNASEPLPTRTARRRRSWLPKALFEAALIVLSVLVALVVNEWREDQQQSERAGIALKSIQSELQENLQSVQRARANHLAMRESLRSLSARGEAPPPDVYLGGMFNPALVSSSAWEAARQSRVTDQLRYDLVLSLSRIYAEQSRYRMLGEGLVQDLMAQMRREGRETVLRDRSVNFISLQEDFANREQRLGDAYRRLLDQLASEEAADQR